MLNKTESMATEWLKTEGGYDMNKIIRGDYGEPDFICPDGKRFEIKRLYGNKIIFTKGQVGKFLDTDMILVFDQKGLVDKFQWKDQKKTPYKIIIHEGIQLAHIDMEIYSKLKTLNDDPRVAIKLLLEDIERPRLSDKEISALNKISKDPHEAIEHLILEYNSKPEYVNFDDDALSILSCYDQTNLSEAVRQMQGEILTLTQKLSK